jgi:hemoglobin
MRPTIGSRLRASSTLSPRWSAGLPGGPQNYTGRSMKESHHELMITASEWEAFADDLQQTFDKFGVPRAEQAELQAIVASTRADIVV